MKYLKSFNEKSSFLSILGNLTNNKISDLYRYLGETNSPIWNSNLQEILDTKTIITNYPYSNGITKINIKKINDLLLTFGPCKHVIYEDIKYAVNYRFGNCWYLQSKDKYELLGRNYNWDICIQSFEDDWYLVNFGSGDGSYNFWYLCDQFEGLKQLIEDSLN